MVLGNTSLVEERNEGLVGSLDQHELEGVAIESNALERGKDSVQNGATSNWKENEVRPRNITCGSRLTVTNTSDILITENTIFVEVRKATSLFNKSRWETVGVGLVVGELRINEVVNLSKRYFSVKSPVNCCRYPRSRRSRG